MTETAAPAIRPPAQGSPTLPPKWNPAEAEVDLYQRWMRAGHFGADAASDRPAFCIVLPPPNVTGDLHIGHALDHTLADIIVRRRRMQGYETLWLPGMDHAGIATQNVVEKQLAVDGKTRHDFGRELFVQKVWDWKRESGGAILGQMRRLGDSVDWSRERFTLDEGLSNAVLTIFKSLYDDGLIYRAERIINWCPRCTTALSDIEVDHEEVDGELVSLRYGDGNDDGNDTVVVATTRVETMLGDTAVAVHPDDERYAHLIGREVELPLVGRRIPVVADEAVDPEFGTGAVKVTPAHDPNDFEIGQRHDLPMPSIMDEHGIIAGSGTRFDGMDRFVARDAVREELRRQGRVVGVKYPYRHAVGHCSRCDTVVEPRLSLQWFVRVEPLAKAAGDAVRDGRVTIHPKEMEPRWFGWVDHMHDWCISRQLWWGHRIPVWYGPDGEVLCLGPGERPPSEADGWRQDEDVLDTWFSSALWPFSTLGWPEQTADLARFYPTSVLVTGYDILFFWVARMMMFGLYAMQDHGTAAVPFHVVALHGLVRDQYGKKMSKSRNNTVDPLEWIERYGADALRFTLARGANPGSDQAISEDWVAGSRNFGTKLWNATRFALMNGADPHAALPDRGRQTDADRWILDRLDAVTAEVDGLLEDFQFGKAAEALYHFAWDDFCDWYVELAKVQLDGEAAQSVSTATRAVLGHVLDVLLRLLHPTMPFVTEALWTTLTGRESVVVAPWPSAPAESTVDSAAAARVAGLQKLVTEIRRFRSDQGLKPGQRVSARLSGMDACGLAGHEPAVRALGRLDAPGGGFAPTVTFEVGLPTGTVTVELDTSVAIDVAAERARLDKDLAAARKELSGTEAKLGNASFTERAPAEVVDKVRARRAAALAEIERIEARLAALSGR